MASAHVWALLLGKPKLLVANPRLGPPTPQWDEEGGKEGRELNGESAEGDRQMGPGVFLPSLITSG